MRPVEGPAEFADVRRVVGRWAEPELPDPDGPSADFEEDPVVSQREPRDPWHLPRVLHGEEGMRAVGIGLQVREKPAGAPLGVLGEPAELLLRREEEADLVGHTPALSRTSAAVGPLRVEKRPSSSFTSTGGMCSSTISRIRSS